MKKDITHKNFLIELLVPEIRSKHNQILNVSHKKESSNGNTDTDIINSTVASEIIPSENYARDNSNVDSHCISELQPAKSNQSTWRVVRGKNKNRKTLKKLPIQEHIGGDTLTVTIQEHIGGGGVTL